MDDDKWLKSMDFPRVPPKIGVSDVYVPQHFPSKNRSPISSGILPLSVAWFPTNCSTLKEVFRRKIGQSKCILFLLVQIVCVCSWFHQYSSVLSISGHIFVDQISKLFCSNGGMSRSIRLGFFTTLRFYIAVRHHHSNNISMIEVNGPWLNHGPCTTAPSLEGPRLLDVQGLRCGVFAVYRPRMFAGTGWRTMGHGLCHVSWKLVAGRQSHGDKDREVSFCSLHETNCWLVRGLVNGPRKSHALTILQLPQLKLRHCEPTILATVLQSADNQT